MNRNFDIFFLRFTLNFLNGIIELMKNLREVINDAVEKKVAIGHFNISNLEGFWAVVNAAKSLQVPVIIGASEGERDFIGVKQIKALVQTLQDENLPVYLNADHSYSSDRVREVIDVGFDGAIIDGAEKSLEENIKMTRECVDYRNSKNADTLIEAELGFIGKSSKLLDSLPEGVLVSKDQMTTAAEAHDFVQQTGIDLFAPAVGNVHGMIKNGVEPRLDIDRIREIREACGVPLVLHGASGNSDEDIRAAIEAGISIIHINTEVRLAFKQGLQQYLLENPDELAPYKYLKAAKLSMQAVVEKKLRLFNNL